MTLQTTQNPKLNHPRSRLEDNQSFVDELKVLQRIGRALNSTLDEKEILELLLQETVATTPAVQGSVFLYDKQQEGLHPQTVRGYAPEQFEFVKGIGQSSRKGIVNRVFTTGQIAVTDDVCQDPDYVQVVPETRSELTVPIRYGIEVVGVIDLESPELCAFGPDTQQFVLTIAEQAGMAIGNARRYAEQVAQAEAATRRNEQLRDLLDISRRMRSEQALDDLLDIVVHYIPVTVGFNIALLSLLEGDPPMFRRVAAAGVPLEDFVLLQQVRQPLEAFERLLQDEYRISESFFFPHQKQDSWDDEYTLTVLKDTGDWQEGQWHPDDMLLVPLRGSKGELLGLLSVDDPQDGFVPSQNTVEALELYAHEAALAIENARLSGETRQYIDQLELLRRVGLQVVSSLNLTTVLDAIVTNALQVVPASDARIYLYDQATGKFDCGTQRYRDVQTSRPMATPREDGFTARVAQKGEIIVIHDAKHHELYTRPESSHWGIHATAGFPLKRADEVVGVMDVSFFYEHTFTQTELNLLSMLANQATVAIDNARLYEHAQRRAKYLEALWHINQQLASILDFDQVLNQVVNLSRDYFDYDHIHIYLVDELNNQIVLQDKLGQVSPILTQTRHGILLDCSDDTISWVATHNKPLLLVNGTDDPICSPSPLMKLLDTKAELAVPLRIGDRVIGVLDVHSKQENALTREDLSIIQSLGAQLSVVLENAQLYNELESRVQKRTEELGEALRRQALEMDKTKAILESISDAVIVFDPQGHVTLANPSTMRVLGVASHHWEEASLDDKEVPALLPQGQAMMQTVFQVVRSAQQSLDTEQDPVTATFEAAGRVIVASLVAVALKEHEPLNIVAVFRDATQEAQLSRMKSEFIAMAAHELRTPMTSIKGYVSLLSMGVTGPVNAKQHEFLRVVNSNVDRLTTLVSDLLDISKIEDEGLKLHFAPVSLADVVAEVTVAMQKQIEAKGQHLSVDVPIDLPDVIADRDRMVQVVINLLSNASKYTPRDGALAIRGEQVNGYLMLDVCDTGIGITPKDQERLFTRFFRAENAMNTQEGGTGLGLAICYEIVERHGGEIQVESTIGKGSTFRIVLPLLPREFDEGSLVSHDKSRSSEERWPKY